MGKWIDKSGNNYSSEQVAELLLNYTGWKCSVKELEETYKVGRVYKNGSIWFQRLS